MAADTEQSTLFGCTTSDKHQISSPVQRFTSHKSYTYVFTIYIYIYKCKMIWRNIFIFTHIFILKRKERRTRQMNRQKEPKEEFAMMVNYGTERGIVGISLQHSSLLEQGPTESANLRKSTATDKQKATPPYVSDSPGRLWSTVIFNYLVCEDSNLQRGRLSTPHHLKSGHVPATPPPCTSLHDSLPFRPDKVCMETEMLLNFVYRFRICPNSKFSFIEATHPT